MRAFIGVEFPWEVKDSIIKIQRNIRSESISGRWKYIDNFHLTLKFLGEVTDRQVESIYCDIRDRIGFIGRFQLHAGGIGFFNGQQCLRVIYLKVFDNEKKLKSIFNVVEECCSNSGIEREKKPYTPHITVAQDVVLKNGFDSIKNTIDNLSKITIDVEKISIIKSCQVDGKRVYTPVKTIALAKS